MIYKKKGISINLSALKAEGFNFKDVLKKYGRYISKNDFDDIEKYFKIRVRKKKID